MNPTNAAEGLGLSYGQVISGIASPIGAAIVIAWLLARAMEEGNKKDPGSNKQKAALYAKRAARRQRKTNA